MSPDTLVADCFQSSQVRVDKEMAVFLTTQANFIVYAPGGAKWAPRPIHWTYYSANPNDGLVSSLSRKHNSERW